MKDPYVFENGTLMNKLNITDYHKLNQAEADIGFVKLISIQSVQTEKVNIELLKGIHKYIFEDIFEWAGEFRTVPLYKEEKFVIPGLSLEYGKPEEIEENVKKNIASLNSVRWKEKSVDEKSLEFAKRLARLWRVHPFRDGNTRTILAYAEIYAHEHGFPMDMSVFINNLSRKKDERGNERTYSVRDLFVFAALDEKDCPEPERLAGLIKKAILSEKEKKRKMKENENKGNAEENKDSGKKKSSKKGKTMTVEEVSK